MSDEDLETKYKKKSQSTEQMTVFIIFVMALISLTTAVCYGMMVAYTTMYVTGIKSVVLGFIQFSMAFISLVITLLASQLAQNFYPQFPSLENPPDRAITFGLWHFALASFIVGDPLFMELRDDKIMKSRPSWVQAMNLFTLSTSIALGVGFLLGVFGFVKLENDWRYMLRKKKD
ncbi:hypothetical protein LPJ60_005521 [Coemansia sp. RSA 2675]|nr:hypothetical protein LPJ60_005521 [Coemansia sp. RSA 2675]KAJ2415208.1 hypothetical protein GGI10_001854 [Coemansia sp. RSA 2530]